MDPYLGKNISYVVMFFSMAVTLVAGIYTVRFDRRCDIVSPYKQPIRTATASVEISIKSDEKLKAIYADRGGYMIFGKGKESLLSTSSTQSSAKQTGKGELVYSGIFNMDANDPAVGKRIYSLKEAEYCQFRFEMIPDGSDVIGGKAVCTLNGYVRIEIDIPAQVVSGRLILARDIASAFAEFKR